MAVNSQGDGMNRIFDIFRRRSCSSFVQESLDKHNMYYGMILSATIGIIELVLYIATFAHVSAFLEHFSLEWIENYRYSYLVLMGACTIMLFCSYYYLRLNNFSHTMAEFAKFVFALVIVWFGCTVSLMDYRSGISLITFATTEMVAFAFFYFEPLVLTVLLTGSFAIFLEIIYALGKLQTGDLVNLLILWVILLINGLAHSTYLWKHYHLQEEMQLRSVRDALTGLRNRTALRQEFTTYSSGEITALVISIDSFSDYDLTKGRDKADLLLKTYAESLRETFGTEGTYRYGDSEFLILMRGRRDQFLEKLMQFRSINLKQKTAGTDMAAVTFCAGHVHATIGDRITDIRGILHEADDLLREARARGAGTILGKESEG